MLRLSSALQAGRRQVSGRDKRPRRVIASVRPSIRAGLAHHVKASPELEAKINPEGNARDNPLLNQAKRRWRECGWRAGVGRRVTDAGVQAPRAR